MLDNHIVMLVVNITLVNALAKVHSVLDNKALNGPVLLSVNRLTKPLAEGSLTSSAWWMHHDSVGYMFPENCNSSAGTGAVKVHIQTTSKLTSLWSDIGTNLGMVSLPMFSVWLTWKNPLVVADMLAYMVVLSVMAAKFNLVVTLEVVQFVSNTACIQVVYHTGLWWLGVIFWAANKLTTAQAGWWVSVNMPCVVMLQELQGSSHFKVTVADPTQLLTSIHVTINHTVECTRCTASTTSLANSTTITQGVSAGSSTSVSTVVLMA
jgi:hypothetical protein